MTKTIFVSLIFIGSMSYGEKNEETKIIGQKKKESISCPGRNTHLFCEVNRAFDTPGVCGHGFDCIMMKSGEKKTVCSVVFECAK